MKYLSILFSVVFIKLLTAQNFDLPKLAYEYAALEPFIDAQTMEIHYSRHHKAYVANLNKALEGATKQESLQDILLGISRKSVAVRNNAGGHYNHTLFWEILGPQKNTAPSAYLNAAIIEKYSSLDSLKKLLSQAASTRFGSGWAWLIVTPEKKIQVCSTPNQDNPLMDINPERGIPILGIDVWEHAYYLKYQNKRGDYLSVIWNVVNWEVVSQKYEAAMKDPLLAYIEKDSWKALKEFHKVLAETFHPVEENNFEPIKTRSAELAMKALNLSQSVIPKPFQKEEITSVLDNMVKQTNALHKLISKRAKDEVIKTKMIEIHDLFHSVEEKCAH
jgi:superoxide dismutase